MAKTAYEQKKAAEEQQRIAAESLRGAGERGMQRLQSGYGTAMQSYRDQEKASRSLIQQQASQALGGALAGAPRTGMGARLGAAQSTTGATTRQMLGLEADLAGQRAAAAMGFGQQAAGMEMQAASMEMQAADALRSLAQTGLSAERETAFGDVQEAIRQNFTGSMGTLTIMSAVRRAEALEAMANQYSDPALRDYILGVAAAFREASNRPDNSRGVRSQGNVDITGVQLVRNALAAPAGV